MIGFQDFAPKYTPNGDKKRTFKSESINSILERLKSWQSASPTEMKTIGFQMVDHHAYFRCSRDTPGTVFYICFIVFSQIILLSFMVNFRNGLWFIKAFIVEFYKLEALEICLSLKLTQDTLIKYIYCSSYNVIPVLPDYTFSVVLNAVILWCSMSIPATSNDL